MYQLDIFADSIPVQRANALIAALSSFDRTASFQALVALTSVDPENAGLPHFQVLCEFVTRWPDGSDVTTPCTPTAVVATAHLIQEQLIPAATVMGDVGKNLVHRCWFDLGQWSEAAGIGAEHPDCFAAELYLRAQQASDVVRTAQGVLGAAGRAAVQRWMGLGHHRCGDTKSARSAVLRYAWLAPQGFGAFVNEMNDAALTRDWRNFQADLGDLDAVWFPAWCAHENKGETTLTDDLPPGEGPMAYRLVTGLARRERGGLCASVYKDRARLKRLDESFFAFYMSRRSDLQPRKP